MHKYYTALTTEQNKSQENTMLQLQESQKGLKILNKKWIHSDFCIHSSLVQETKMFQSHNSCIISTNKILTFSYKAHDIRHKNRKIVLEDS